MSASEYHLDVSEAGEDAPALLAFASGLSKTEVKRAMQKGAVWLSDGTGTRRLRRSKKTVSMGNQLHFYYNPTILNSEIKAPELLADNSDYSIWIKPRGVLSQGSKWGDHCTITRWVETNDEQQRPALLIHRLDRAASGLMIIGHSKQATRLFTRQFARQTIHKTYHAVVSGEFTKTQEPLRLDSPIDMRSAVSHVQRLQFDPGHNRSLLEICIETGRKHQIRKHLSEAGFAIVGDRLYGGGDETDLQLAAVSLAFQCPFGNEDKEYHLPDVMRPTLNTN